MTTTDIQKLKADFLAKCHRELLQNRNAVEFICTAFGHRELCAAYFESPWSETLRGCPDYVEAGFHVWTMTEVLFPWREDWARFFREHRPEVRRHWMTREERQRLASLPETVAVWRGYRHPHRGAGMAWTLHEAVARKVPLARERGPGTPFLIKGEVLRDDIIVYTNCREEEEVIAMPDRVRVIEGGPA